MKVLVPDESVTLLSLLSPEQISQIEGSWRKFSPERGWVFEVTTSWQSVYFENNAPASVDYSTPLTEGEWTYTVLTEWLWNIHVLATTEDTELRFYVM